MLFGSTQQQCTLHAAPIRRVVACTTWRLVRSETSMWITKFRLTATHCSVRTLVGAERFAREMSRLLRDKSFNLLTARAGPAFNFEQVN